MDFVLHNGIHLTLEERTPDVAKHWPAIYDRVDAFQGIASAETPEFEKLRDVQWADFANMFVLSMDSDGLKVLEGEIGIRPLAEETLEYRKRRLIWMYTRKPPFTMNWLNRALKWIVADEVFSVTRNDAAQTLTIKCDHNGYRILKSFLSMLEETVPMNMLYQIDVEHKVPVSARVYMAAITRVHKQATFTFTVTATL